MPEREDLVGKSEAEPEAEFDRLLRSALDSYADPGSGSESNSGSDSGLADRVLARIAAEPAAESRRESRLRWLPWTIAVPVAAGLLILILLFGSHPLHRPTDNTKQARVLQPSTLTSRDEQPGISSSAPGQRAKVSRVRAHRHSAQAVAKTAPLPKLPVFPTPQPLTPSERALADYAAHASQADRQALVEAQKRIEEPLSIAAIEIQPLEPPKDGGN